MVDRVEEFVGRALGIIAAEDRSAAAALARLAPETITVQPRGTPGFGLGSMAGVLAIRAPDPRPRVLIEVDSRAIDGLLFGQSSLVDAITRGDLDIYGASEDIAAFDEFIRGCLELSARSSQLEALALQWRRTR